jgi:hypothetical protein
VGNDESQFLQRRKGNSMGKKAMKRKKKEKIRLLRML